MSAIGTDVVGALVVVIWGVLLFARDGWWRTRERDGGIVPAPVAWPAVVAVVPARDEAGVVGRAVTSLAVQDYPGEFRIILVDDGSSDGTAEIARDAFTNNRHARKGGDDDFEVISASSLAAGWTGKLAAVAQGVAAAGEGPTYLLLTDADIEHTPDLVRSLVVRAVRDGTVLTSLMARLRTTSLAERTLVPAFVWFFAMLFPFAAVNRPGKVAAAAGGVMLVDRAALERAGGIAAIRHALIDDCALAKLLKEQGPIALLLTDRSVSLRAYPRVADIGVMIARSAYAQLDYSPLLLVSTLVGLTLTFVAPPLLAAFVEGWPRIAGIAAWAMMSAAFQPMLRFYRRSPAWGAAVPVIAAVYGWYTLISAIQHWRGRGGQWKGRVQARARSEAGA